MKNFEKYYNEIKKRIKTKESADTDCLVYKLRTGKNTCEGKACYDCCLENIEWLNEEYQESILDEEEKEIIKEMLDVIIKFGCEINYVIKNDDGNGKAYILLSYSNKLTGYSDGMTTPWFKNDKFKGMEIGKEYKLEDLSLENVED